MEWTPEAKLSYLLSLNWTIKREKDPDEGYVILRVAELPSAVATGDETDPVALEKDFWESLTASLESSLQFEDKIELPKGAKLPWDQPAMPTPVRNLAIEGDVFRGFLPQPKQTGSAATLNTEELAVA